MKLVRVDRSGVTAAETNLTMLYNDRSCATVDKVWKGLMWLGKGLRVDMGKVEKGLMRLGQG